MACYIYFYQQIASRTSICARFTFITDTDTLTIVNTCRNSNGNLALSCNITGAMTIRTFLTNDLTRSMTVRTGLHILHHAKQRLLGIYHFPFSPALAAGFR